MANEYGTKLTLKDNFSAVIQKAISATEALRSKLQSTEKELDKLGNKKVKIGAQLDSSVHSSLNKLGDKIPKDKVIKIKAKDEVTRNVTNMQRDIYKMGREISMGMRDPFKGLNSSALNAARNLAMVRAASSALMTGAAMRQMAASSLLPALVGGATAGRVAGGLSAGRTTITPFVAGRVFAERRRSINVNRTGDPDYYESQERNHRLGAGDAPARFNRGSRSMTYFDADRADMISRQQQVMKSRYGMAYMPRYSVRDEHIGGSDFLTTLNKKLGRAGFAYQSAKETIGDKIGSVKMKVDVLTNQAMSKLSAFKQRIGNSKIGEIAMRMKFAGERGLYGAKGMFGGLASKAVTIATKFKDLGAMTGIGRVLAAGKTLAKPVAFTVKAITSAAHAAINGLKTAIKGLAMAAGAIVIGGAATGIKGAAEMEQNIISIEHFVKYANTKKVSEGKGTAMSDAEIKKASADYMGGMRKYADETSFSTGDVMNAGRRAVNVMNGDLSKADELVKIAGDMAALNPGKTIMDAMEALADMKTGEMERMKEFGLKISAEQFKGLVGKGKNDDLSDDETAKAYQMVMNQKLKTMFGGGAKKMGETASGKWSTLIGSAGSALTDVGTMFLPGIKIGLDSVISMISGAAPRMIAAFKPLADGFNAFMSGGGSGGNKFSAMFQQISAAIQPATTAFNKLLANGDLMKIFAGVVAAGGSAIKLVMEMLGPVFSVAGVIIADVMTFMGGHIVDVQNIFKDLSMIWASSWPVLSDICIGAWGVIKPALEALWNIAMVIVDVFTLAWPLIAGAVRVLWAVISPIFSALGALLEGIAWAAGKAHQALQWVIDKKAQLGGSVDINVNNSASNDGSSERAVGMEYIPYNGFNVTAHRGEAILTRTEADNWRAGKSGSAGGVIINIHDPVVREESDLDRLGTMLANKISEVRSNMGAVPAFA